MCMFILLQWLSQSACFLQDRGQMQSSAILGRGVWHTLCRILLGTGSCCWCSLSHLCSQGSPCCCPQQLASADVHCRVLMLAGVFGGVPMRASVFSATRACCITQTTPLVNWSHSRCTCFSDANSKSTLKRCFCDMMLCWTWS